MSEKRNTLVDVTRVIAAAGIILSHVDLKGCGPIGTLLGQFLSVRFSLMFFLAVIGFYLEKSYQYGKSSVFKRIKTLSRVYIAWTLIYLVLSFVLLVLIENMPLKHYFFSRLKGFLFSGSYYHFWFYPAVIYALLFIAGIKKLLGNRSLRLLIPLSITLYSIGLLGTGYLPIGRKIPGLQALYAVKDFDAIMHLFFLGLPSVVFGMAAAHEKKKRSGRSVIFAAAVYLAESILLCLILNWKENPQMLLSTPLLTACFLQWAQSRSTHTTRVNPALCRTVSAGMYNVHPLILAAFAVMLPELAGPLAFLLCTAISVLFGWLLYCLRKNPFIALFM